MAGDDYAVAAGSLKLKGVKGGKIEKKKKKKSKSKPSESDRPASAERINPPKSATDAKASSADPELQTAKELSPGDQEALGTYVGKTEAEIRHEEMRRKRVSLCSQALPTCNGTDETMRQLNERLKKEGVKTHKEKVEDLNKYLSNLSEHHDMYVSISISS